MIAALTGHTDQAAQALVVVVSGLEQLLEVCSVTCLAAGATTTILDVAGGQAMVAPPGEALIALGVAVQCSALGPELHQVVYYVIRFSSTALYDFALYVHINKGSVGWYLIASHAVHAASC